MLNRILTALAALLAFAAPCFAQLTPTSAQRVISAEIWGTTYFQGFYVPWHFGPNALTASGFDPFDETVSAGSGANELEVTQYSVLTPTESTLIGRTISNMSYGPPHGQPATGVAFSEVDVSFVAAAGTTLQFAGTTQGWARFTVLSNGSTILQDDGSLELTVLQDTSFSVFATTRRGFHGIAWGEENFNLTITATPAPSSVGVLALAAAGCFARRRRVG